MANSALSGTLSSGVLPGFQGLVVSYASASTLTITATQAVMVNTSGIGLYTSSVSETVNIASSGAGGLDTGSEASSTFYYIWLIGKSDGTVDGLLSTSSSSPTMPSGYTFKALCGCVRNDASSNFINFRQRGKEVYYVAHQQIINSTTVGAETDVSSTVATVVPSIANSFNTSQHISMSAGIVGVNAFYYIVSGTQWTQFMYAYADTVGAQGIDGCSSTNIPNTGYLAFLQNRSGAASTCTLVSWVSSYTLPILA